MGMCILASKPETIYSFDGSYYTAKLDLQVSTAADLPELGGVVPGTPYKCGAGSTAQIVQADEPTFVTLDSSDETWYPEQS